jgi:DNA-binding NarL/FixJ family response regulator
MLSLNVVLAQHDPATTSSLVNNLRGQCRAVTVSNNKDEIRNQIMKSRAEVAVLDLEMFSLPEVKHLCDEFKNVSVVCTHRLADEEIWTEVMNAGASDCCLPTDVNGIMFAVRRSAARSKTAAA